MSRVLKFQPVHPAVLSLLAVAALFLLVQDLSGQTVVDKTVATVSDGIRTELITYSDLKWQLAMQPGITLNPPRSEDLNIALNLLINQRIFALEAERIPRDPPGEKEVADEINRILAQFPSAAEFERRLRAVGFESVRDDNFERLIAKRVAIEKYLDFRFRSFIVNTPEEVARYYNNVFVPDFRRRFPGLLMPTLDERRDEIGRQLTEAKLLENIEAYLDDTKRRVEIVVLKPV
ncbi:MAG: hypothetical protein AB7Q37_02780 [Pyrinomonadaceae bacterium]